MKNIFSRYQTRKQNIRKLRKKSFENQFTNDADAIAKCFRQAGKDLNQSMSLLDECIGIAAKDTTEKVNKNKKPSPESQNQ